MNTLKETKKFVEKINNYPEDVQEIIFSIWNLELDFITIEKARNLCVKYPELTILSCIAGIDTAQFSRGFMYAYTCRDVCFNFLKQFNKDLFLEE